MFLLTFIIVGEVLVRFDKAVDPLEMSPKNIIVKVDNSALKNKVDESSFKTDSNQIRILVIGDSYIHGGGISSDNKFSKQLERLVSTKDFQGLKPLILDVSRPSNNTLDNYNYCKYYQKLFKPDYIFWSYHYNDVMKTEIPKEELTERNDLKVEAPKQGSKKEYGLRGFINSVYKNIEIVKYVSATLQKELKLKGIVLPIGNFHYLTNKAYAKESKNWMASQALIREMANTCVEDDCKFILFRMPQFNLMDNTELFDKVGSSLDNFSNETSNIKYVNGLDLFAGKDASTFMLSRYDGHPNGAAHRVIAELMLEEIIMNLPENMEKHIQADE